MNNWTGDFERLRELEGTLPDDQYDRYAQALIKRVKRPLSATLLERAECIAEVLAADAIEKASAEGRSWPFLSPTVAESKRK
jgi:hypothetical protein